LTAPLFKFGLKEDGSQSIYVGDGYSDTCPAGKADLLFAKAKLYRYCREQGIDAVHFNNFKDIIAYFMILLRKPLFGLIYSNIY